MHRAGLYGGHTLCLFRPFRLRGCSDNATWPGRMPFQRSHASSPFMICARLLTWPTGMCSFRMLEAALRPAGLADAGKPLSSASPSASSPLDGGAGGASGSAPRAVPAWGQGQAGGVAPGPGLEGLRFDGRPHSEFSPPARSAARPCAFSGETATRHGGTSWGAAQAQR